MHRKVLIALAFAVLTALPAPAQQPCYWQAPVADNLANPPPVWIKRCDLGTLPTTNDPATIDRIEVINPGTNPQKYLREAAQAILQDAEGRPMLLNYIIPFTPKRSTNLRLIAESQALAFHFYNQNTSPVCIGIVAPICLSYTTANPAWAN